MTLGELRRRISYLLHRDSLARELEEEMRLHVDLRAEALKKSPLLHTPNVQTARFIAQRQFGNMTTMQQRSRDMWGFGGVRELLSDVSFALRRMRRQRAFALTVIVVMAIGIGATTAIFSAVDAVLLRPLPFVHPEKLAVIGVQTPNGRPPFAPRRGRSLIWSDIVAMPEMFTGIAAYAAGGLNLSDGQRALRVNIGVVTANLFQTLGVSAIVGRNFTTEEGVPGGADAVILSHALWQNRFGARDVSGMTLVMNKRTYRVVGVMPAHFSFPDESDLWIPMTIPTNLETFEAFRDHVPSTVVARLADNVTMSQAADRLTNRWQQLQTPRTANDSALFLSNLARIRKIRLAMLLQQRLTIERRTALYMLLGATALLLLIACANVTNLLLAHASARTREIAVRKVLGATRLRVVRQLLVESVLMSLAGASFGILIAVASMGTLRALMPPDLAGVAAMRVDVRMLSFAVLVAVISGIVFGLWPAWGSAKRDANEAIKSGGGHGATSGSGGRVRRALVAAELALTVTLLIGSSIMLRNFESIVSRAEGVNPDGVGTMELAFPYSTSIPDRLRVVNEVTAHLTSMRGVIAAGASKALPFSTAGDLLIGIDVDGFDTTSINREDMPMTYEDATAGYFPALGIPLLQGRLFTDADNDKNAPKVAIIDAAIAKLYWPSGSAVGHTFHMSGDTALTTVVGVVANVPAKLDEDAMLELYHPIGTDMPFVATIVARSSLAGSAILSQMSDAVHQVDPSLPAFHLRMMAEVRDASIAPHRTSAELISIFALLALTLASVGVYAVVSYGMSNRARELGIRSALGASGRNLVAIISREMIFVSVVGVTVGIAGAWALAHTLQSLVYNVDVHDRFTFAIVPLALLVPVLLATLIPARRAMRVNPADVMRAE